MLSHRASPEVFLAFCTIIANNYLAYARVLAESVSALHPGTKLAVLVIDADDDIERDGGTFEVITPSELGIDPAEYHRMATIYDVTEMSTAVKPWLLRGLLDRGAPEVIYLDPDIQLFTAVDDIAELAGRHGIVLTPHRTQPVPRDGLSPSEKTLLECGVFNLGFIAVGGSARPFLDWWAERLRRDCIRAVDEALFVDQRWVDFVPALFDAFILRDPACNVAYWNLDERAVEWTGGRYEVNGRPLRFFHFSGFEPETPHLLSKRAKKPRVLLSQHPAVARLCREYADELVRHGHGDSSRKLYRFARDTAGLELQRLIRRIYREELIQAERFGTQANLPDPFDPNGGRRFIDWLSAPAEAAESPRLSRYLYGVYRKRGNLQKRFPSIPGPDSERYVEWIRKYGAASVGVPRELVPPAVAQLRPTSSASAGRSALLPGGVNVAGYFLAESGVGEQARLLLQTLEAAGIPHAVVTLTEAPNRQEAPFQYSGPTEPIYDLSIVCVNAGGIPRFARTKGGELLKSTYSIGYWAWEIEHFPEWMRESAQRLSEVWGDSTHTAAAIRSGVDGPVFAFPPAIVPPPASSFSRADLGLPGGFLFLYCFDHLSVVERKNPLGLVRAFSKAFSRGEGPTLVVKSIAGDTNIAALERLRLAAAERPDIVIMDGYISRDRQHALMQACDVYISLHRAEGFGLTMAEAMSLGKPVIATGYSGNLDYMTDANSFLVPHRMVPIPRGCDPYPEGALWAEPDLEEAARLMRLVYEDPAEAKARAAQALRDILALHSPEARAPLLAQRLAVARRVQASRARAEAERVRRENRRRMIRAAARALVPPPLRPWARRRWQEARGAWRTPSAHG